MTVRTVILYWDKDFVRDHDGYDDYYYVKHNLYKDIIVWLRENGIWYHNVQRDGENAHFEVLYMEEEDAMAFKLRWTEETLALLKRKTK